MHWTMDRRFSALPAGPRRQSLRAALFGLLSVSLLPLVLVAAIFLWKQWDLQRTAAIDRLQERARTLALAVDRELGAYLAVLETLAALPEIDARDWPRFRSIAVAALEAHPYHWIVLMEASGQEVVNTRAPAGSALPNLLHIYSKRQEVEWQGRRLPSFSADVIHQPILSARPIFSNLFYGPVVKRPVLAAAVPVMRAGRPAYSLGIGFTPDALIDMLVQQGDAETVLISVIDHSGRVIARSRNPAGTLGVTARPPFDRAAQLPDRGKGIGVNLEGQPVVYAYQRLASSGWMVAVAITRQEAYAAAYRSLYLWLFATLALAAGSVWLAQRLGRRLAQPLSALAEASAALQRGEVAAVPATSIREIDTLARAL